jgi:hypothetical protein
MRPSFRSIRRKICSCLPDKVCWACEVKPFVDRYNSNDKPIHAHTWNEAVRIHNKEVCRRRKKTLDRNKRIPV